MMNPDGDLYLILVQPGSSHYQAGTRHTGWAIVENNKPLTCLRGPVKVKVISGVLKAVEAEDGERFAYFGEAAKRKVIGWPQDAPDGPDRVAGVEYEVELLANGRLVTARLWACTKGLKHLGLIVGDEVVLGWKRKPLPEGVGREGRQSYLWPVAWGVPAFPTAAEWVAQKRQPPDQDKIDETLDRR